jgi:hypothetical protein
MRPAGRGGGSQPASGGGGSPRDRRASRLFWHVEAERVC